jgi:YgiT-type zinc finger domain-containing protein
MKCVICKSPDVAERKVEEEIRVNNNIVFIPIQVMVCNSCGEKYYSRQVMKQLEDTETKLKKHKLSLKIIGKVLRASAI